MPSSEAGDEMPQLTDPEYWASGYEECDPVAEWEWSYLEEIVCKGSN